MRRSERSTGGVGSGVSDIECLGERIAIVAVLWSKATSILYWIINTRIPPIVIKMPRSNERD